MKPIRMFASVLALVMMAAGTVVLADAATWAATLQEKVASLDLSADQKSAIAGAFGEADELYEEAIAATRETIGRTLTGDQKQQLGEMANAEIQRRLQGDTAARTKSIADIASDLGITDAQSSVIREALGGLGETLDGVDAGLRAQIKSILNEEQLAKVMSWF